MEERDLEELELLPGCVLLLLGLLLATAVSFWGGLLLDAVVSFCVR